MSEFSEIIKSTLLNYNSSLSDEVLNNFIKYAELLVEWNQKFNLTAITTPKEIAIKHFIDSLTIFSALKIPNNATILDVGTGAGFPGIPLKIVRPDINLTLLDSLNKRLLFLREVCSALNISAKIIHARAEEAAHNIDLREKFDIVTSRAVASLNILLEYCVPFVKVNGYFAALKGSNLDAELSLAKEAISKLNVTVQKKCLINLISINDRTIIVLKKTSNNSAKYPRNSSKISKKPL